MSMSKKDYVSIARAISDARPYAASSTNPAIARANEIIDGISANIADACALDNPRFDRARFLRACGVQS